MELTTNTRMSYYCPLHFGVDSFKHVENVITYATIRGAKLYDVSLGINPKVILVLKNLSPDPGDDVCDTGYILLLDHIPGIRFIIIKGKMGR